MLSILRKLNIIKYKANICGHMTARKGRVESYGLNVTTSMPLANGSPDYCIECIGKMGIKCAWCSEVIFIGEPITLYSPKEPESYKINDGVVAHSQDPLQLVGCLRWECASTGGDRAGFWHPSGENDGKGTVKRVMSPIEMAISGGKPVFVGDLGDVNEAVKLQDGV